MLKPFQERIMSTNTEQRLNADGLSRSADSAGLTYWKNKVPGTMPATCSTAMLIAGVDTISGLGE